MKRQFGLVSSACLFLMLAACGGGGGGGGGNPTTSISASPTSVTFTAVQGAATPPPAATVQIAYQGAAVVAGYAPGVAPPSWLTVAQVGTATTTSVTFSLTVNDTSTVGTRTTSVRFATGLANETQVTYVDVAVTYTVTQPFDATTGVTPLAFTGVVKSTQPPQPAAGYPITVVGSPTNWTVSADQPWIKFSPASGTNSGTVTVTADNTNLANGSFSGNVRVVDQATMSTRVFPVTLDNRTAKLTVSPASLTFNIGTTTPVASLTQLVNISDELNSAQPSEAISWTLQPGGASWLQWTPASGSSVPAAQATAALNPTELQKLMPGQYTTNVVLTTVNSAGTQTVTVPVTLNYQPAYVSYVAPYVGIANQAGTLIVRGVNFAATPGPLTVTIGSTQIANITADADSQLTVNYPALAAGSYVVAVKDSAGLVASNASLVLIPAATVTYHSIAVPAGSGRLVFDAERQVLYAVNQTAEQIEPFTWSGGILTAGTPYAIPQLRDIALTSNGRKLVALSTSTISDIPLTGGAPFVATTRASEPGFSELFTGLVMTNDGTAFVTTQFNGSGFTPAYLYSTTDYSVTTVNGGFAGDLYDGLAAASGDGGHVYAGSNGVSPAQLITIFSTIDHTIANGPNAVTYNLAAASVSVDASRVILNSTDVYPKDLSAVLGYLPAGVTLTSRDASKAYVFHDDAGGGGPRLDVYNLNGTLGAGAQYPLLKTITLADEPNAVAGSYYYNGMSMVETPDGNTVFISGNNGLILVVPVN